MLYSREHVQRSTMSYKIPVAWRAADGPSCYGLFRVMLWDTNFLIMIAARNAARFMWSTSPKTLHKLSTMLLFWNVRLQIIAQETPLFAIPVYTKSIFFLYLMGSFDTFSLGNMPFEGNEINTKSVRSTYQRLENKINYSVIRKSCYHRWVQYNLWAAVWGR